MHDTNSTKVTLMSFEHISSMLQYGICRQMTTMTTGMPEGLIDYIVPQTSTLGREIKPLP